ncbi:Uncharacterised protein [Legionella beliardensis]|uniref:Uncharacterized protein n=1 Tax=Legionella beliardensis TaxID=91822 RepID=A0A378I829_9GAMM|nr:hypothetical protein [Legionella beliardensis]STX28544.1 Uncharacterised protein [Legionella beliardensis]
MRKKLTISDKTKNNIKWNADETSRDVKLRGSSGHNRAVMVDVKDANQVEYTGYERVQSTKDSASKTDVREVFGIGFFKDVRTVAEKKERPTITKDTFTAPDVDNWDDWSWADDEADEDGVQLVL